MSSYRVVALEQRTADKVRSTMRAPGYGHPAHVEIANGPGPCRLCLAQFREGAEERVLFTFNPFAKPSTPAPGPVFVHKEACARYEAAGFPDTLRTMPMILEGHDGSGTAVARVAMTGDPDVHIADLLARPGVAFAHIRNAEAGCFIARVEPA